MKKTRKQYSPEQKVQILRLHLLEHQPVSELCEKHGLQPSQFYQWQKQFFEKGTAAFEPRSPSRSVKQGDQKLASLEAKLKDKDEIIAEIMGEHVKLKKELGEL
ncbi:MAG: transposase [Verrucomicrobiales bacterium]|nr:transposase [Verrucomicrobiales bacterium]